MKNLEWRGHGAMLGAEVMWGVMAPLSKIVLAGTFYVRVEPDFADQCFDHHHRLTDYHYDCRRSVPA